MMDEFLNNINMMSSAILVLVAAVASGGIFYMVGWSSGFKVGFETEGGRLSYWTKAAVRLEREKRELQAIVNRYSPYFDNDQGENRWRDPRTGEFVDEDHIIDELKNYRKKHRYASAVLKPTKPQVFKG